ncbi:MAG: helix-turn-helix transcriptional regulator [Polyangiaceae bacterium]
MEFAGAETRHLLRARILLRGDFMYAQSLAITNSLAESLPPIPVEQRLGVGALLNGSLRVASFARHGTDLVVGLHRVEVPIPTCTQLRERRLLAGLVMGRSQKQLGYECGVSPSTVCATLQRIVAKCGAQCWEHLVAASCILNRQAGGLHAAGSFFELVAPVSPSVSSLLTAGELDVALQVVEGYPNAEIASRRHSKSRTVANQISSAFQKLSAHGRLELILRLVDGTPA